ncbi:MAG: serine hydrolase [Candidatus Margulisiibacteriota bacterium]
MQKIAFIILLTLLTIISLPSQAVPPERLQTIQTKLDSLTAPYGKKIGIAFIDLNSNTFFHINGSAEYPAASVAKVPVMATAYYFQDAGKADLEKKLTYRKEDRLGGSGVLQWMRPGNSYTMRNLIRMMISLSDNTATKMTVDEIGLENINTYIKHLGLNNTTIADSTMLKERPEPGINLTSPLDMAYLTLQIEHPQGFSDKSRQEMLKFMKNQRYHWGIWRGVPPGTVVADKTGNLDKVLNDVGIVYTKHGNFILSIFTRDFTKQRDARKLINEVTKVCYEGFTGEKVPEIVAKKSAPKKYKRSKKVKKKRITKKKSRSKRRNNRVGHL